MKKCFEIVLGGVLVLWPMLAAPAQEPVRIVVAEQSAATLAPVETKWQVDSAPGVFADDDGGGRLWSGHFVVGAGAYIIEHHLGPFAPPALLRLDLASRFGKTPRRLVERQMHGNLRMAARGEVSRQKHFGGAIQGAYRA